MSESKRSKEVDRIKLSLEKKLLEIEKNKKINLEDSQLILEKKLLDLEKAKLEELKEEAAKKESEKIKKTKIESTKKEIKKAAKVKPVLENTESIKKEKPVVSKSVKKDNESSQKKPFPIKKVILTILFVVSFLILAYLYQLRQDLNAKKEVLKEMKEEQIDYSKEDARFKDVEEDSDSEELQNIE